MRIFSIIEKIKFIEISAAFISNIILLMIRILSKAFVDDKSEKIVVLSFHRLGDTVLTIPTIKYLYQTYKEKLVVVCFEHSQIIYNHLMPDIFCKIITTDELLFRRFAKLSIRKKIRKINPKNLFDITGQINSISAFIGLPIHKSFGFSKKYFLSVYDRSVLQRTTPHLTEIYFDVARLINPSLDINIYRDVKVKLNKEGVILIHPFAGWRAKEWSMEKYLELAKKLIEKYSVQFIIEEKQLNESIKEKFIKNNIEYIATKNLKQLIEEIEKSMLIISNDSGPIHLAGILGKPTFSIYGPTNPEYSMPFGIYHSFVRKVIHCTPMKNQYCYLLAGIDCPYIECMDTFEVADVIKELEIHLIKISQE